MIKSALFALVAGVAALGATSAHAGGVSWSIGINVPVLGAVVSNAPDYYYDDGPRYAPAPVYAPAPYYRAVPRVVYEPRYEPRPIYYQPAPVAPIVYQRYYGGRDGSRWDRRDHGGRGDHPHRGHRDRDRDGYRDGHGGR